MRKQLPKTEPKPATRYSKPSIVSMLLHLEVGEFALFPVWGTTATTMNRVSTAWTLNPLLKAMRFTNSTFLLVRQGEVSRPVVICTRLA